MTNNGDTAAIIFLLAAFVVILGFKTVRQNKIFIHSIWLILFLRTLIAIINCYFFTVIGAGTDAVTFQNTAEQYAVTQDWSFAIGSLFYVQLLGYIYSLFGTSHLLGASLSIFAFSISCVVLLKIMQLLSISDKNKAIVLILYGALPSSLCFGSATLREPFQILFFMLTIFFSLKYSANGKVLTLLAALFSCMCMAIFHKGLVIYALFFTIVIIIWPKTGTPVWSNTLILNKRLLLYLLAPIGIILTVVYFSSDLHGTRPLKVILEGRIFEYIQLYRHPTPDARANYGLFLDNTSLINLASSISKIFAYYLFAPFPSQITHAIDIYAALESILRFLLIVFCILAFLISPKGEKRIYALLLTLYFSMTFLWALGTVNYGTAMRHHLVSNWIILVLGIPPLLSLLNPTIAWNKKMLKKLIYKLKYQAVFSKKNYSASGSKTIQL